MAKYFKMRDSSGMRFLRKIDNNHIHDTLIDNELEDLNNPDLPSIMSGVSHTISTREITEKEYSTLLELNND